MTCRIEPVSAAAAGALALLHLAAFPEEPWDAGALTAILTLPGSFGRIACGDEVPAGFVVARDLGKECEILLLGVVPERRRRGIGSALLRAALNEARRCGLASAVLEVATDNEAAQALYARFGFVRVGRRARYYQRSQGSVDALILRACLSGASFSI